MNEYSINRFCCFFILADLTVWFTYSSVCVIRLMSFEIMCVFMNYVMMMSDDSMFEEAWFMPTGSMCRYMSLSKTFDWDHVIHQDVKLLILYQNFWITCIWILVDTRASCVFPIMFSGPHSIYSIYILINIVWLLFNYFVWYYFSFFNTFWKNQRLIYEKKKYIQY